MSLERKHRRANVDESDIEYFVRQRRLKLRKRGRLASPSQQEFFSTPTTLRRVTLPSTTPIKLQVRCSGALHKVSVTLCGAITFHNHTKGELSALRTLKVLGDETCGCLLVPERVRSGRWAKQNLPIAKTTQRTVELRKQLNYDFRPDTSVYKPPTKADRFARIETRIRRAASNAFYLVDSGALGGWCTGLNGYVCGVSDAAHPPGVRIVSRESYYTGGRGWTQDKGRLIISLPLAWVLQISSRTHIIEGHVCTKFVKLPGMPHGYAELWVRTGVATMEKQEHPVTRGVDGVWRIDSAMSYEWLNAR
jgi:hypothetical protein